MNVTIEELRNTYLPWIIADSNSNVTFKLSNGDLTLPNVRAAVHAIFWRPIAMLGYPIPKELTWDLSSVTDDSINDIQSKVYDYLIDVCMAENKEFPQGQVLMLISETVDILGNYTRDKHSACVQTIDLPGLIELIDHPKLKPLIDHEIDTNRDIKLVETELKELSAKIVDVVKEIPPEEGNQLSAGMRAEQINKLQLPQLLKAYGFRADIDGVVKQHFISSGALHGTRNPADVAIDALSARQSQFFNEVGVSRSQHNARKLRIVASTIQKVYAGDCGNRNCLTIPLKHNYYKCFVDNSIMDGPNRVLLTKENIRDYVGKEINLISPTLCRHHDGVCDWCHGWAGLKTRYYLPNVRNLGRYAITILMRDITQKLLSNKHFNTTFAIMYELDAKASDYFVKHPRFIFLSNMLKSNIRNVKLVIPRSNLTISDLELGVRKYNTDFSSITDVRVMLEGDDPLDLKLSSEESYQILSDDMVNYLYDNTDMWECIDDEFVINMAKFKSNKPIFEYIVFNMDMLKFSNKLISLLRTGVSKYKSLSKALETVMDMISTKMSTNVYYIQLLLKSYFIYPDPLKYQVAVVDDPNNVLIGKLDSLAGLRSIYAKLGFEWVRAYFSDPAILLRDGHQPTGFEALFGVDV